MVAHLNRTVLAGGRVLPVGTAWSQDLSTIPDAFWDGPVGGPEVLAADGPPEPPRAGRGSGASAWRSYAAAVGVDVPDGASRDEIVAAVDAR